MLWADRGAHEYLRWHCTASFVGLNAASQTGHALTKGPAGVVAGRHAVLGDHVGLQVGNRQARKLQQSRPKVVAEGFGQVSQQREGALPHIAQGILRAFGRP